MVIKKSHRAGGASPEGTEAGKVVVASKNGAGAHRLRKERCEIGGKEIILKILSEGRVKKVHSRRRESGT